MIGTAMVRHIAKFLLLGGVVVGGSVALYHYERSRSREAILEAENRKLLERKKHLEGFVARLSGEKRVAEIVVTDQKLDAAGKIETTTLMFLELGKDGSRLLPRFFTIKGNIAHLDSLVIKFDRGFIEQDDPLRGHSLVLFYRLYGDFQAPNDGFRIDDPEKPPAAYCQPGTPAETQAFEAELWKNFWKLAEDPAYRQEKGVRVAQGEGPWTLFHPDQVYSVSIETAGGVNLVARPMDGLFKAYRDALKNQTGANRNP